MSVPTWYAAVLQLLRAADSWKFQATPTVQSAPEQRALIDRLAVSKRRHIALEDFDVL